MNKYEQIQRGLKYFTWLYKLGKQGNSLEEHRLLWSFSLSAVCILIKQSVGNRCSLKNSSLSLTMNICAQLVFFLFSFYWGMNTEQISFFSWLMLISVSTSPLSRKVRYERCCYPSWIHEQKYQSGGLESIPSQSCHILPYLKSTIIFFFFFFFYFLTVLWEIRRNMNLSTY